MHEIDVRIAAIATVQFGAFSRAQAEHVGATRAFIAYRLRIGRWTECDTGVYAIAGSPSTWERRVMVAVLASGAGSVGSHRTALRALDLIDFKPNVIDVTRPLGAHHGVGRGRIVHRARTLTTADVTTTNGLLVTCTARTLVDAAGVFGVSALTQIVDRALRRQLASPAGVRNYVASRNSVR